MLHQNVIWASGMKVKWDGRTTVEIRVPPSMSNDVCGLCGDYNGDVTDDFRMGPGDACDIDEIIEGQIVSSITNQYKFVK